MSRANFDPAGRDTLDADTLPLDIDLGFEVIRRQSIRFARIDAPRRDTPEGAANLGRIFLFMALVGWGVSP